MKLPIKQTRGHAGKSLVVDSDNQTITLVDLEDQSLGSVGWSAVSDFIRTTGHQHSRPSMRRHVREQITIKAHFQTEEGRNLKGVVTDIGGGGLFIETTHPVPEGTELKISFAIPDHPWEPIDAHARVVWTRARTYSLVLPPGMGVLFAEMQPEDRSRILDFLSDLDSTT